MSRYIPQPAYPDAMPVDISFVFESEKPAGRHGFIKVCGDDLRFEDGTLARFWGVNFNGGACFPEHDYSPKVARRLAQAGCNIVRFHQMDAEFDTPNIYGYTKGKRVSTTRELDPRSLDALDYLIFCLKQEGIYVYFDMSTYRHYKAGDGVPQTEFLFDNGRPWANVSPELIALQKEFAAQIWNHVNPYTGLAYKDDPVFVLTELLNENDIFTNPNAKKRSYQPATYYENQFRGFFKEWLEKEGKEADWENIDLFAADPTLIEFKLYMTEKYYLDMQQYFRELGVKIPITGTNWYHTGACAKANAQLDFTDNHHYFYDWQWGNTERVCQNRAITSVPAAISRLGCMKVAGKPMFISEWDMPWPNSYRAEGSLYYAAVGALQGWSGFAIHTYAYGTRLDKMEILGKEQSSPVGGIPYREGIFSVWNDPAKFGLFYHAALITRRQDVQPTDEKVAVLNTDMAKSPSAAFDGLLEQKTASCIFEDKLPEGYQELVRIEDKYPVTSPVICSANGQLRRDLKARIGYIDTDRTQVVYGFLAAGGAKASTNKVDTLALSLKDVEITASTDFGVIALSSLTDAPIRKSDNILISAIGRARNTGAQFDGEKMIDRGQPPILAEVIEADVRIHTECGEKLKVWGVNAEGFYAGKLPTTYENGVLSFHIGDAENPACYYLVVAD